MCILLCVIIDLLLLFMAKDSFVNRALSFILPITVERCKGEKGHELEVTIENGQLVLNSNTANYSFGTLHKVWRKAIAKIEIQKEDEILVLGAGAGSIRKIVHDEIGIQAHLTMIEAEQVVLDLGAKYFGFVQSSELKILKADAFEYCSSSQDRFNLILIDLFTDLNIPNEVSKETFWNDIDGLLNNKGVIMLNTIIHDNTTTSMVEKFRTFLSERYGDVQELILFDINHVFIVQIRSSL